MRDLDFEKRLRTGRGFSEQSEVVKDHFTPRSSQFERKKNNHPLSNWPGLLTVYKTFPSASFRRLRVKVRKNCFHPVAS